MDKYEYKLKLDEMRELFQLKNYKGAAEIADEINWNKVRNSKTLCMVADVYEALERYDACQEVLMQAYDHSSVGRNIVGRLTDIAIKSKDVASAEEYYNEFLELAPKDTQRYVFAYKIACLKNAPVADRIAILEEFKEQEYSEMWAYELAVLYAQAGMREKCVETCDELILWFGDGEYVERALDLKRSFQPLTPAQEEKFQELRSEKGMVEKGMVEINIPAKSDASSDLEEQAIEDEATPDVTLTATKFNTQNLQEEIANSMQQIMDATEENTVRDQLNSIKKIVQDIPYLEGEEEVSASQREKIQEEVNQELKTEFQEKVASESMYAQNTDSFYPEDTSGMSIEEILQDWEKTKAAAQEAMAAAEQKKLDLEKEQALTEANAIMKRLEELVPILSATPEDIPDSSEGTIADELLSAEPIILTPQADAEAAAALEEQEEKSQTRLDFLDDDEDETSGTLPEDQAVTSPIQEVLSRAGRRQSRNPQDKLADVESLDDFSEEEQTENATVVKGMEIEDLTDDSALEKAPQAPMSEAAEEAAEEAVEEAAAEEVEETAEETVEEVVEEEEFYDDEDEEFFDSEESEPVEEEVDFTEETVVSGPDETEELLDRTAPIPYNEVPYGKGENDLPSTAGTGNTTNLPDDVKEIFSYFIPIPGMADQISLVLDNTAKNKAGATTSATGNVIVQGEEGSGKTMLATDLIKAVQQNMNRPDDKIGKITAEGLNTKNFAALVPRIAGGYLIVEHAGELTPQTVAEMSQVMEQNTGGMTVVLEDDSAGIRRVLGLDPKFAAKFTEKIKIPIFTIDELVDFAKAYAVEQECEIDEMAVLALYNRINSIQKLDHPTTLTEVKEIVDEAIDNAEGGGIKKLFAKKYNDEDFLILHEEDFGNY